MGFFCQKIRISMKFYFWQREINLVMDHFTCESEYPPVWGWGLCWDLPLLPLIPRSVGGPGTLCRSAGCAETGSACPREPAGTAPHQRQGRDAPQSRLHQGQCGSNNTWGTTAACSPTLDWASPGGSCPVPVCPPGAGHLWGVLPCPCMSPTNTKLL